MILYMLCIKSISPLIIIQTPTLDPGWSLYTLLYLCPWLGFIFHWLKVSQWALMSGRPTYMDIIYLTNWSLGAVLILPTFVTLNIPHFRFFYWVPITCIRIEFVPMSLDILCMGPILNVFRYQPQTLGDLGQHFLYFIPICFQICQRLSQWAFMTRRLTQMNLV